MTKRLTEATRVLVSLELEMGWEEGGRVLGLLVCLAGKKITRKKKNWEMESGKLMRSGGRGSKTEN